MGAVSMTSRSQAVASDTWLLSTTMRPDGVVVHHDHVWGQPVTVTAGGGRVTENGAASQLAFVRAMGLLNAVDAEFSALRASSSLMAIRRGSLSEADAPRIVRTVLARARVARTLTGGAFDPWAGPEGLDLNGFVRGWAVGAAADLLVSAGFAHVKVDAGSDVAVRGGAPDGRAWHLTLPRTIAGSDVAREGIWLTDGSLSISGLLESSSRITDPRQRKARHNATVSLVVGADAGLADALATALLVDGPDGGRWLRSLTGWSAAVVMGSAPTRETLSWGAAFRPRDL